MNKIFYSETSSPLQAATKLVPVPESLMSPDFRPPSGLSRILPKTPTPSKLSSPCQITIPCKPSIDGDGKAIPIINTVNPMAKTNLNTIKANVLAKSNSATNCSVKPNIAKPIVTYANSKYPHSVKINNYVQSKTLPAKRNTKSPNLGRNIQRPKSANERLKNINKEDKDGDADNRIQSSDEDSEVCQAKLDSIRHRAIQRRQEDSNKGIKILIFNILNINTYKKYTLFFYIECYFLGLKNRSGSSGKSCYLHSKNVARLSHEKSE